MFSLPTEDKARKRLQAWTYLTEYFPDSFMAEVEVAVAGNEQHNKGEPLHWARDKSKDQMNTAFRHMLDHASGVTKDTDGQYHLAKARWRLGAELQLLIEKDREAAMIEEYENAECPEFTNLYDDQTECLERAAFAADVFNSEGPEPEGLNISEDEEEFEKCPKCKTRTLVAEGIGAYCPNFECSVVDDLLGN